MKSYEQIVALLRARRYDEAKYACMDRVRLKRQDAPAWGLLVQSLVGLRQGIMAEQCLRRFSLLDPFTTNRLDMVARVRKIPHGRDDAILRQLLAVTPVTVSAVVLTRNSARTIRRCLAALDGAVDDIVVVDTGSTDETVAIIESQGIEAHHLRWQDDFASARNYAQSLVHTEWTFMVDSDEILVPEDREAVRMGSGIFHEVPTVLGVMVVNTMGTDRAIAQVGRLLRTDLWEWVNPVHEHPRRKGTSDIKSPLHTVEIRLLHDGYDPAVVDLTSKLERNVRILEAAHAAHPERPDHTFFLGRELLGLNRLPESVKFLEEAYHQSMAQHDNSLIPDVCMRLHAAYIDLGDNVLAYDVTERFVSDCPEHPQGWFLRALESLRNPNYDAGSVLADLYHAKQAANTYRGLSDWDRDIGRWKVDYWCGRVAEAMGDGAAARAAYNEVLRIDPTAADAAVRLERLADAVAEAPESSDLT